MSIQDTWREHLVAIVDRLAPENGRGKKRPGFREVAARAYSDVEYVYQVYTGKSKPGEDFAKSIERAFGEGREPGWINIPLKGVAAESREIPTDLTSEFSEPDIKPKNAPYEWRQLEEMTTVPAAFEVTLGDGAMAPSFEAGQRIECVASSEPEFGEHIIVRDPHGKLHFRLCQQAAGGGWEAFASAKGFRTLAPSIDGIRIVAVMTGFFTRTRRKT